MYGGFYCKSTDELGMKQDENLGSDIINNLETFSKNTIVHE